ncbi:pectate lyase [Steroidobacter agaridevorans]|uniref:pectate lyase n=1 Tax=Steroidobacter agaridevorans TaxID=2695856 RepID=UPI0013265FAC|nr:pectate lyase [Steroidobacter agaridevorans]GFE87739.1 pectate lyase [Steroidobacter agaridevorans]
MPSHRPAQPISARAIRFLVALSGLAILSGCSATAPVAWNPGVARQASNWYRSAQARGIADSVLQYQSAEGGWPKNTDLAKAPRTAADIPSDGKENTFDNDGTTLPMEFLARVVHATGARVYRDAFNRGLDYTLAAQYPNGGWPQFYPLRSGYYSHITFNDDAMIRVMSLLRDIASGKPPYEFVDDVRRERAAQAVARGIDLILRTQIKQNGFLTAWCAQYDERTLEPAWARRYEPPSLSGSESVGILRFLMSIEAPTPQIVAAIEGGVRWLRQSAIVGIRLERFTSDDGLADKRVMAESAAETLWARFYELGSNRPIFLGRDSVFRYNFAEIERERRTGYGYYGTWPRRLLDEDYPAWKRELPLQPRRS